ncbi:putative separase [Blattamonas nauphoetae]|uniref:separase n=1 Tax=Blattamonas nauphoetae TaxID=2049346 RepID=A0ABQ9YFK0_9EUKA|nr:putative separase [Blattamonas nauphoetae]
MQIVPSKTSETTLSHISFIKKHLCTIFSLKHNFDLRDRWWWTYPISTFRDECNKDSVSDDRVMRIDLNQLKVPFQQLDCTTISELCETDPRACDLISFSSDDKNKEVCPTQFVNETQRGFALLTPDILLLCNESSDYRYYLAFLLYSRASFYEGFCLQQPPQAPLVDLSIRDCKTALRILHFCEDQPDDTKFIYSFVEIEELKALVFGLLGQSLRHSDLSRSNRLDRESGSAIDDPVSHLQREETQTLSEQTNLVQHCFLDALKCLDSALSRATPLNFQHLSSIFVLLTQAIIPYGKLCDNLHLSLWACEIWSRLSPPVMINGLLRKTKAWQLQALHELDTEVCSAPTQLEMNEAEAADRNVELHLLGHLSAKLQAGCLLADSEFDTLASFQLESVKRVLPLHLQPCSPARHLNYVNQPPINPNHLSTDFHPQRDPSHVDQASQELRQALLNTPLPLHLSMNSQKNEPGNAKQDRTRKWEQPTPTVLLKLSNKASGLFVRGLCFVWGQMRVLEGKLYAMEGKWEEAISSTEEAMKYFDFLLTIPHVHEPRQWATSSHQDQRKTVVACPVWTDIIDVTLIRSMLCECYSFKAKVFRLNGMPIEAKVALEAQLSQIIRKAIPTPKNESPPPPPTSDTFYSLLHTCFSVKDNINLLLPLPSTPLCIVNTTFDFIIQFGRISIETANWKHLEWAHLNVAEAFAVLARLPATKLAAVILERIELATKRNDYTAVLHLIEYLETIEEVQTSAQKVPFRAELEKITALHTSPLDESSEGMEILSKLPNPESNQSNFQPFITQCLSPTRFSFIPIHAFHFLLVSTLHCLRRPFPLPPTFMQFVPHSQPDHPGPTESPAHTRTDPTCFITPKTDQRLMERTPTKNTPAEASRTPTLIGLMDGRLVVGASQQFVCRPESAFDQQALETVYRLLLHFVVAILSFQQDNIRNLFLRDENKGKSTMTNRLLSFIFGRPQKKPLRSSFHLQLSPIIVSLFRWSIHLDDKPKLIDQMLQKTRSKISNLWSITNNKQICLAPKQMSELLMLFSVGLIKQLPNGDEFDKIWLAGSTQPDERIREIRCFLSSAYTLSGMNGGGDSLHRNISALNAFVWGKDDPWRTSFFMFDSISSAHRHPILTMLKSHLSKKQTQPETVTTSDQSKRHPLWSEVGKEDLEVIYQLNSFHVNDVKQRPSNQHDSVQSSDSLIESIVALFRQRMRSIPPTFVPTCLTVVPFFHSTLCLSMIPIASLPDPFISLHLIEKTILRDDEELPEECYDDHLKAEEMEVKNQNVWRRLAITPTRRRLILPIRSKAMPLRIRSHSTPPRTTNPPISTPIATPRVVHFNKKVPSPIATLSHRTAQQATLKKRTAQKTRKKLPTRGKENGTQVELMPPSKWPPEGDKTINLLVPAPFRAGGSVRFGESIDPDDDTFSFNPTPKMSNALLSPTLPTPQSAPKLRSRSQARSPARSPVIVLRDDSDSDSDFELLSAERGLASPTTELRMNAQTQMVPMTDDVIFGWRNGGKNLGIDVNRNGWIGETTKELHRILSEDGVVMKHVNVLGDDRWWELRLQLDRDMEVLCIRLSRVLRRSGVELDWAKQKSSEGDEESVMLQDDGECDETDEVVIGKKRSLPAIPRNETRKTPRRTISGFSTPSPTLERIEQEDDSPLVLLFLSPELISFPWENTRQLQHRPVARMTSLSAFLTRLQQLEQTTPTPLFSSLPTHPLNKGVDPQSVCCVINPDRNMDDWTRLIQPHLLPSWTCHIDERPTLKQFKSLLQSHDVYLYCGHGSGQHLYSKIQLSKHARLPVMLMMGCSSGRRAFDGEHDAWGYVDVCEQSNASAILGNLWDVIDGDENLLVVDLLERWLGDDQSKRKSLHQCLIHARQKCIEKYLVGAAMVAYGFPIFAANPEAKHLS